MIENDKQAKSTLRILGEFKESQAEFENSDIDKTTAKYRLYRNAFNGIIKDLEEQLSTYETLKQTQNK